MHGNWYDLALKPMEKLGLSKIRADLLKNSQGNTLEIGIGTGLNIPHYPGAVTLTGIDPDPEMLARARIRAQKYPVRLLEADAERLPFLDQEFDTVVATLVFCSIPNPERALCEIYRVLKPQGRFLLLEHVRKNSPVTGWFQDSLTPLWKRIAGGCHLNRNPGDWIRKFGFEIQTSASLWYGLGQMWVLKKNR